jgi:hypothetical protein
LGHSLARSSRRSLFFEPLNRGGPRSNLPPPSICHCE